MDQAGPGRAGRRVALIAAVAGVASLLAAAPAAAANAAPGVAVETLPFTASYDVFTDDVGGPGLPAANERVADDCNGGAPIWRPQWFQLPQADTGPLQFQARAVNLAYAAEVIPSGAAVVLTRTGQVVSCGDGVVTPTAAGEQLSVVAWFGGGEDIEDCDLSDMSCTSSRLQLGLDPTGGVAPPNDDVEDATAIPALPFQDRADLTLATTDGPRVIDYDHCLLSSVDPVELHTVWWRYTPTRTENLSVTAKAGLDRFVWAGVAEVTPSGPVRAPRVDEGTDPWDCDAPVAARAGRTYLIGVVVPHDRYDGVELPRGASVDLRVGAVPTPGIPLYTRAAVDGAARTATLSWLPPQYGGTSPVTGYRVWRDGTDSGGTGPWSTTLPADARSLTFRYLNPWDSYRLSVQAVNASGTGARSTRVVSAQGPAASAPQRLAVRPGVRSATVTWDVPKQAGSGPLVGWRVRRFDGASWTVQASSTVPPGRFSLTATGLVPGRRYSFEVVQVSGGGVGAGRWARSAVVSPASGPPGAPVVTSAAHDDGARSATITWRPPAGTGGVPVTGYRVARDGTDSGGTGAWSAMLPPTARSQTFLYLTTAAPYRLTVAAVTAAGTGPAAEATVRLAPATGGGAR